jgi:hypothetical protein
MAENYQSSFVVPVDPRTAYDAILNVRNWWGGEIEGSAAAVGDEFTYRFEDLHVSRQRVTELVPGAKVVWHVVDGVIGFVADKGEWDDTDVVFDIRPVASGSEVTLTHRGLSADKECFEACSGGWNHYFGQSLKYYIGTLAMSPV